MSPRSGRRRCMATADEIRLSAPAGPAAIRGSDGVVRTAVEDREQLGLGVSVTVLVVIDRAGVVVVADPVVAVLGSRQQDAAGCSDVVHSRAAASLGTLPWTTAPTFSVPS